MDESIAYLQCWGHILLDCIPIKNFTRAGWRLDSDKETTEIFYLMGLICLLSAEFVNLKVWLLKCDLKGNVVGYLF